MRLKFKVLLLGALLALVSGSAFAGSPAEIDVFAFNPSSTLLTLSPSSTVDFGSVPQGDPFPAVVIRVANNGGSVLSTSALVVNPSTTFLLVGGLSSTILSGQFDEFTIEMSTAVVGQFNGSSTFTNDDSDENPFFFNLSGTVTFTDPAAAEDWQLYGENWMLFE